ncbi:MAG: hemerythrin family protein [Rhodobacteraceae bacterium]|nr:hemerythrin family protein [Paracoccaceae bacterium]MCP5342165.1 hemerythrin family protein [Paracoccaceae bacterium]
MALIDWKPEYSVGDPAVDHEHRELIDLVNNTAGAILGEGGSGDVSRAYGDLLRAVTAHFAHEERQMQAADYDQMAAHKGDHERLIDALRDLMDGEPASSPEVAERLVAVLGDWFSGHFATHDARLHNRLGPHSHD